jgi:hypothetical protein
MKPAVFFILLLTLCVSSLAQNVPFSHLGRPFSYTNLPLVWDAPTNHLPRTVWIYRAVPSEVSPMTISNSVALGSFTEKDRKKVVGYPRTISYADPSGKRTLWINSDWSFIDYANSEADNMHISEGVPSEQQALEMGIALFPKLGVDRNQLAKKPNSDELRASFTEGTATLYKTISSLAYATNLHMRGVTFMRSLDGIDFSGGYARGGCTIEFGHHAKISRIRVAWRKFVRDKLYETVSPDTLGKWITEGKAVWYSLPDSPDIPWPEVKKITINKITSLYYSEGYSEYDKPQNWACPFAEMAVTADCGKTNFTFFLDCPILSPNAVQRKK